MHEETIEVITSDSGETTDEINVPARQTPSDEPNYILRVQLLMCLFIGAVLYFSWRQGGELWHEMSFSLKHVIQDGISFSGQDELTRFTDEVRGLLGNIASAFAAQHP